MALIPFYSKIQNNPQFIAEVDKKRNEFLQQTIGDQALIGERLLVQKEADQEAMTIMAEYITEKVEENDDLKIENSGLRSQLGRKLDEQKLARFCSSRKTELGSDLDRKNRILADLNKKADRGSLTTTDKALLQLDKSVQYSYKKQ